MAMSFGTDHDPTSLSGDFYREPDDVERGVSLAPPPPLGGLAGSASPFGDCYQDANDIFKGVPMGIADLHSGFMDGLDPFSGFPGKFELGSGTTKDEASVRPERFMESDSPPQAPSDLAFSFESTTLYTPAEGGAIPPFILANRLLDFLDTEVVSSVTKVRRQKFTIKADVFVGSIMCTIKIRVYSASRDNYAIEFQRRRGDCVAFSNTFERVARYLAPDLCVAAVAGREELPIELPLPIPSDTLMGIDEAGLQPLLDMACHNQAEAAAALAERVQDSQAAAALCSAPVFEVLASLLQSDQVDVAYPTARLLSRLATRKEAATLFHTKGLLPVMQAKAKSAASHAPVRQELTAALRALVPSTLSDRVYRSLDEVYLPFGMQHSGAPSWG